MMVSTRRSTRRPSGDQVYRPAPSLRIMPARSMSWWLTISASAGISRVVVRAKADRRMYELWLKVNAGFYRMMRLQNMTTAFGWRGSSVDRVQWNFPTVIIVQLPGPHFQHAFDVERNNQQHRLGIANADDVLGRGFRRCVWMRVVDRQHGFAAFTHRLDGRDLFGRVH